MQIAGWSYDIAREQSPDATLLRQLITRSAGAGYNLIGLYLEHRFVYTSAPWAAGPGALTPATVRELTSAASGAGVRILPMLNTLGHMEGFIRAAGGEWLGEAPAENVLSLQTCPTRPECRDFARGLVADALAAFDDPWIHLGGDETRQLGACPACAERVATIGVAGLYGEYFGELCRWTLQQGRRPCLWADMLLAHPAALDAIPRETVLFDWQYDESPADSTARLRVAGFDVVCCPALHTFDSGWCFWPLSQKNVDEHFEVAAASGALGVLLTTWEFSYFNAYGAAWPLIYAVGRRLRGAAWEAALAAETREAERRAIELLGRGVPAAARLLAPGTWRTLRDRLIIRQNPFWLWRAWRAEAGGPAGDEVLRICDAAQRDLPSDDALALPIELHRVAVLFVRAVEAAARQYGERQHAACVDGLRQAALLLDRLRPALTRAAEAGGSAADLHRLDRLIEAVNLATQRVCSISPTAAYRPSFEAITHAGFVPGDQAGWRTSMP